MYIVVTFLVIYLMEGKALDGKLTINELNCIKQIVIQNIFLAVFLVALLVLVGVLFLIKYILECKVKNQEKFK
ncbi:hypothetical protein ACEI87_09910 [Clostridioides difficile]